MADIETNLGIGPREIGIVGSLALRIGEYAETLLGRFDLGIDRARFRSHLLEVCHDLNAVQSSFGASRTGLRVAYVPDAIFAEDPNLHWNGMQDLRFAVGASLLIQNYRKGMSSENAEQALTAKIAHMCLMGILDDVVDRADVTHRDAMDLYRVVLSATLDPRFDADRYARDIAPLLRRAQPDLVGPVSALTTRVNNLLATSPRGSTYVPFMSLLNSRLTIGQAATMFQKNRSFQPGTLDRIGSQLWAPNGRLRWWERIAAHVSVVTWYNLIDLAFSRLQLDPRNIPRFMEGWYYFDAAVTLLHHVANIQPSLRAGIANLSLFGMREADLRNRSSLSGYRADLTADEYKSHLREIAGLAARGLGILAGEFDFDAGHHAFIGVMMPVVLLADWIGTRDELVHAYVAELAPAIRRAAVVRPLGAEPALEVVI